jgi:hypothetical protein
MWVSARGAPKLTDGAIVVRWVCARFFTSKTGWRVQVCIREKRPQKHAVEAGLIYTPEPPADPSLMFVRAMTS